MTEKTDDLFDWTIQRSRPDRVLDRMDRAVARLGRAIWRCVVDGFAAYAMAEYATSIHTQFDHVSGQEPLPDRADGETAPVVVYDDLPGDLR